MLLAKGKLLSAVAGLAMMAIPVSAFAGHRHDNFQPVPPPAAHDRGFHNGWWKHPHAAPPPVMPVTRPMYRPAPVPYVPAPRPVGWNNGNGGWNNGWDNGWHEEEKHEEHAWHHRPENWHPMTNYVCDEDGDDCHYVDRRSYDSSPTYGNYNQGQPYYYDGQPESWYLAPAPSNDTPDQRLSWLIARRQRAMVVVAHMRAQGDSRGAQRVVDRVVNPLSQQINLYQQKVRYGYNTNSYNYAPSGYAAPAPSNPLVDALANNQAYYGNQPNNPINTIGAVVAPMLLGAH